MPYDYTEVIAFFQAKKYQPLKTKKPRRHLPRFDNFGGPYQGKLELIFAEIERLNERLEQLGIDAIRETGDV